MTVYGYLTTNEYSNEVWIPDDEVRFHPHSFSDPGGRLFRWQGNLYRAISSQHAPFIKNLVRSGVIDKLVARGLLVETELTHYRLSGYDLILGHRSIPLPSYPNEWCAAMLKDAALATIEICQELAVHGLTLKDAHPWNLLYENNQPVWVDLNSIAPIEATGGWQAYEEFRLFCINPLLLMQHGDEHLARVMMSEDGGVSDPLVKRLTVTGSASATAGSRAIPLLHSLKRAFRPGIDKLLGRVFFSGARMQFKDGRLKSRIEWLQRIKREVEKISVTSPVSNGGEHNYALATTPASLTAVSHLMTKLRPASLLDLGGQAIWLAEMAKPLGAKVVGFNTDSTLVTRQYFENQEHQLPLLPLVMDFAKPTPSRGLGDHWAVTASDRLQCEMVLALGSALDDARSKSRLNFEQIAEGISAFSQRWGVIEVKAQEPPADLDQLISALKSKFRTVRLVPLNDRSCPSCMLLLGEK